VATGTVSITILDRPVADAGGPYEAAQGAALMLSGAGSFAAPEAGGITEYAWDLDNDGNYEIAGDAAAARSVPFDTAQGDGLYRVFLRVTAGDGTSEFTSALVNVTDVDPTCNLGGAAPILGVEGEPVSLTGAASTAGHPSDPILVYDWDFGDGLFPQRGDGLAVVNHQFPNQGDYTVRLRVEDQDSFAECTRVVRVSDIAPIVRGAAAFTPANLIEGTAVRFTAGETAPGSPADPLTDLQWNFGDGTVINGLNRNPEHVYANNGTYNVCLTVSDEDSQAPPLCFDVVIRDLSPEPAFGGDTFGDEGSAANFDATNTVAGGNADPLTRLVWNFGDGTAEVTVNNPAAAGSRAVRHTFAASGTFQVTLTAFDEDSSASVSHDFIVYDVQPTARARVSYVNPEQVGFEGVPLTLDASASTAGSPTDPIATYRWTFGDGSAGVETAVPTVQHTWPNEGAYPASVTVVDSDGSESSVALQVNIDNVAPTNVRIVGPAQIEVGEVATWRVEYTDVVADIPPASTRWTVGGVEASQSLSLESSLGALGHRRVPR
jgi:PKD repeat protein